MPRIAKLLDGDPLLPLLLQYPKSQSFKVAKASLSCSEFPADREGRDTCVILATLLTGPEYSLYQKAYEINS